MLGVHHDTWSLHPTYVVFVVNATISLKKKTFSSKQVKVVLQMYQHVTAYSISRGCSPASGRKLFFVKINPNQWQHHVGVQRGEKLSVNVSRLNVVTIPFIIYESSTSVLLLSALTSQPSLSRPSTPMA